MTVDVRIGEQTPTKSLILPYDESLGDEAIELYEKSGREAFDWQRFIVNAILAKNNEGLWTHMNFGYSVPRQNGKNEIVAIVERYGLKEGLRILHTAHRTTTSAAAFNRLLAILEESGLEDGTDRKSVV